MKQSTLLLALIAAWSVPAIALADEGAVQLYGKINLAAERVSVSDTAAGKYDLPARGRVTDGLSYIGFRGNEELSDTLTAFWQVESALKPDDGCGYLGCGGDANQPLLGVAAGNSTLATRNSFVGLRSSNVGQIAFGRMDMYYEKHVPNELHLLKTGAATTALAIMSNQANTGAAAASPETLAAKVTALGGSATLANAVQSAAAKGGIYTSITGVGTSPADATVLGYLAGYSAAHTFYNVGNRFSNVIQYRSPTRYYTTAVLAMREGENKGTTGKFVSRTMNSWNGEVSLQFQMTNFYTSFTHITEHDPEAMSGLLDNATGDKLAIGFHPTQGSRVGMVYERVRNLFSDKAKSISLFDIKGDSHRDTWAILASQKYDNCEIYATFGRAKDAIIAGVEDDNSGARYVQLTTTYNFTKRTNLYAGVAEVKNDTNAAYNFFIEGAATGAASTQAPVGSTPRGGRVRTVQLGVNHFF